MRKSSKMYLFKYSSWYYLVESTHKPYIENDYWDGRHIKYTGNKLLAMCERQFQAKTKMKLKGSHFAEVEIKPTKNGFRFVVKSIEKAK